MSRQRWKALAWIVFFGPMMITIGWQKLSHPETDWRHDPTLWLAVNGGFVIFGIVVIVGGLIAFFWRPE